jgi:hypothetical protein
LKVEALARDYNTDKAFVGRGIEACRRCSVDPEWFVQKYLEHEPSCPRNPVVEEAFLEILKEELHP